MNINGVNPTVLWIGLIVLTLIAGTGEYLHLIPAGTFGVLLGGLLGAGSVHVGVNVANGITAKATAAAAQATAQMVANPFVGAPPSQPPASSGKDSNP